MLKNAVVRIKNLPIPPPATQKRCCIKSPLQSTFEGVALGLMFGLAVVLPNAPLIVSACPVSATDTASHHHAGGVPVAAQRKQALNTC